MVEFEKPLVDGAIIVENITFENYMENYAEAFTEWMDGRVIELSPVSLVHTLLTKFFVRLLDDYLDITGEGILLIAPFVMRISPESPAREPDLHIVSADRVDIVKDTLTDGAGDIVIEIVSRESTKRDRGEKFDEYEAGGVKEYWLIDPLRKEALFYRLEDNHYQPIPLHEGKFHSRVLSKLHFDVQLLWQEALPTNKKIRELIAEMLV